MDKIWEQNTQRKGNADTIGAVRLIPATAEIINIASRKVAMSLSMKLSEAT